MKDKKALAKNYADMAKKSSRNMGDCIRDYLDKLAKEDENFRSKYDCKRVNKAIRFVVDMARDILSNRSGEVADEVCYKMARDYFEDRLWEDDPEVHEEGHDEEKEIRESVKATKAMPERKEEPKKFEPCPGQLDLFAGVAV